MSSRSPARPFWAGLRTVTGPGLLGRHGRRVRRPAWTTRRPDSCPGNRPEGVGLEGLGWAAAAVAQLPLSWRDRSAVWNVTASELCSATPASKPREGGDALEGVHEAADASGSLRTTAVPVAGPPSALEDTTPRQSASPRKQLSRTERAEKFRRLLAEGVIKTRAEFARHEGISRARVSQILGPDPQKKPRRSPPTPSRKGLGQNPESSHAVIQLTNQGPPSQTPAPTAPATVSQAEYRNSKRRIPDLLIQQKLNEKFANGELKITFSPSGDDVLHVRPAGAAPQFVRCVRSHIGPWLMAYAEESFRTLLSTEQKTQFTDWIIGKGRVRQPDEYEDEHALLSLESSPTITAIVEYMRDRGNLIEESAAFLWGELYALAKDRKFLRLRGQRFPGSASALTRRLNQEKAHLAKLGIDVEVVRSNGAQVVLTKREGIDVDMPSTSKPRTGEDLSTKRTADAIDEYLDNRHRQAFDGNVSLVNEGSQK